MTDAPLILRKVALMREHLARARRRRPAAVEDFRADVDRLVGVAFGYAVALGTMVAGR